MDDIKQFLETQCEASYVTDGIKDESGLDGYNMFYTFTSEMKSVDKVVHKHFQGHQGLSCGHSHDCCGCYFLQSVTVYLEVREYNLSTDYVIKLSIGRNV